MKLKIGWREYEVAFEKNPEIDVEIVGGAIDANISQIKINTDFTGKTRQKILIHEVIHGILFNAGKQTYSENEELVECIANGIMQVIYDNEKNILEKVGE